MRTIAIAVAIVAVATVGRQQPDLSGTWQVTEFDPPGQTEPAFSSILGFRFALRVEGNRITVTQILRDELVTMTLEAGGAAVKSRQPGLPCQGDWFPLWTAAWEGNTLVLTHVGSEPAGGGSGPLGPPAGPRRLRLIGPDILLVERAPASNERGTLVGSVYRRVTTAVGAGLPPAPVTRASGTMADVAWIAGSWRSPPGGVISEESWTTPQFGSMMGVARGLGANALVRYEFLCMVERDGTILYQHAPNGQAVPTRYTLTAVSPDSATFENPLAVFPTVIRYLRLPDGALQIAHEGAGGKGRQLRLMRRVTD